MPEETESSSTDEQDLEAERLNDDTDDYDQGNAQKDETAAAQECEAEVARG